MEELDKLGISFIETKAEEDHCILIVHGFGGSKTGKEYIFKRFSDYLFTKDISTFRFDFLGCGESDGNYTNITYTKMQEQLLIILNLLKQRYNTVSIVGISITTFIILPVLNKIKDDKFIKKIVLWNPTIETFKYIDSVKKKLVNNKYFIDSFILPNNYLDGVENLLSLNIEQQVSVMIGEFDQNYEKDQLNKFLDHYSASCILINNADHTFSNYESMQELFKKTYEKLSI